MEPEEGKIISVGKTFEEMDTIEFDNNIGKAWSKKVEYDGDPPLEYETKLTRVHLSQAFTRENSPVIKDAIFRVAVTPPALELN